jgi:hypothetical protein
LSHLSAPLIVCTLGGHSPVADSSVSLASDAVSPVWWVTPTPAPVAAEVGV